MIPTDQEVEECFKEESEAFLAFKEAHQLVITATLQETGARHRLQLARAAKSDIIHRTLTN